VDITSSRLLALVLHLLSKPRWRSTTSLVLSFSSARPVCPSSPRASLASHSPSLSAEESGSGKITLIERGAYKEMDACVMYIVHPHCPRRSLRAHQQVTSRGRTCAFLPDWAVPCGAIARGRIRRAFRACGHGAVAGHERARRSRARLPGHRRSPPTDTSRPPRTRHFARLEGYGAKRCAV
jgi:hypothetical protein